MDDGPEGLPAVGERERCVEEGAGTRILDGCVVKLGGNKTLGKSRRGAMGGGGKKSWAGPSKEVRAPLRDCGTKDYRAPNHISKRYYLYRALGPPYPLSGFLRPHRLLPGGPSPYWLCISLLFEHRDDKR